MGAIAASLVGLGFGIALAIYFVLEKAPRKPLRIPQTKRGTPSAKKPRLEFPGPRSWPLVTLAFFEFLVVVMAGIFVLIWTETFASNFRAIVAITSAAVGAGSVLVTFALARGRRLAFRLPSPIDRLFESDSPPDTAQWTPKV